MISLGSSRIPLADSLRDSILRAVRLQASRFQYGPSGPQHTLSELVPTRLHQFAGLPPGSRPVAFHLATGLALAPSPHPQTFLTDPTAGPIIDIGPPVG
jgi:hypothetical protein